jgi:hypothetical protein
MEHDHAHHSEETAKEYTKLGLILVGIAGVAFGLSVLQELSLTNLVANIMGVFFIVFGLFKLLDLKVFAMTYAGYDLLAKKWRGWGYFYPFIELFLGAAYLLLGEMQGLNLLTILVMGVASIGVIRELNKKSKIQCACLGKFVKLPLSKVSLIEDLAMFIMALFMLAF